MTRTENLQTHFISLAMRLGLKQIGFADLSGAGNPLFSQLPVGISLILPMGDIVLVSLEELKFHEQQLRLRDELEVIKEQLGAFFTGHGYCWHSVSNDTDQEHLTGEMSHKMVAVRAGLGWIGKSSLLVTPEYGPGVRMTTMLTDAPFQTFSGYSESRCGDCMLCVEACPVKAITGREWHRGCTREDLIDVFLCNDYRINIGAGLGRKHSCAHCMRACPFSAGYRGSSSRQIIE